MIEILADYQNQLEAYKAACQSLGKYLDGQNHGEVNSPKGIRRQEKVSAEVEKYGKESIYKTFETPYVQGYPLVVSTFRILGRLNVHTNSDLLALDAKNAAKYNTDFGEKKVELVGFLKEVIRTEKETVA